MISETPYSAQEVALSLLRPGATVLDVGCGDGSFARGARELACTVVGVDRSPAALDAMESEGFECINADLEQVDLVELLGERTFDHVVLLDVLEHLRQPEELLTALSKVLTDDGEMIVSILNVTHLSVRLAMLQGRFNDAGDGLLDRSHVRFFDAGTIAGRSSSA